MALTFDWLKKCPVCTMICRVEIEVCPACSSNFIINSKSKRLTEEQKLEIGKLYNEGCTRLEIIKKLNLSACLVTLSNVKKHRRSYFDPKLRKINKENLKNKEGEEKFNNYKIEGECWIWKGFMSHNKYPIINTWDGKKFFIKRIFYEKNFSPLLRRETVYSTCGNIACVNPGHLQKKSMTAPIYKGEPVKLIQITTKEILSFPSLTKASKFLNSYNDVLRENALKKRPFRGYEIKYTPRKYTPQDKLK